MWDDKTKKVYLSHKLRNYSLLLFRGEPLVTFNFSVKIINILEGIRHISLAQGGASPYCTSVECHVAAVGILQDDVPFETVLILGSGYQ